MAVLALLICFAGRYGEKSYTEKVPMPIDTQGKKGMITFVFEEVNR
jgi:hypothetical protein